MDFSAQFHDLQARVVAAATTVERAATESRAQLKQQIDRARVDVELARKDGKEQVGEAADRAQSKWTQLKSDVSAKMDELKTRADKRADQPDAKVAGNDADWAEMEAADAHRLRLVGRGQRPAGRAGRPGRPRVRDRTRAVPPLVTAARPRLPPDQHTLFPGGQQARRRTRPGADICRP